MARVTAATRAECLQATEEGATLAELAERHGVNKSTVYRWVLKAKKERRKPRATPEPQVIEVEPVRQPPALVEPEEQALEEAPPEEVAPRLVAMALGSLQNLRTIEQRHGDPADPEMYDPRVSAGASDCILKHLGKSGAWQQLSSQDEDLQMGLLMDCELQAWQLLAERMVALSEAAAARSRQPAKMPEDEVQAWRALLANLAGTLALRAQGG